MDLSKSGITQRVNQEKCCALLENMMAGLQASYSG